LAFAFTLKGAVITQAILDRYKDIENRSERLPIAEWVAIHTGKSKAEKSIDRTVRKLVPQRPLSEAGPTEAVVGLCWIERTARLKNLSTELNCGTSCEHHDEATGRRWLRHQPGCRLSPFAIGPFCNVISAVIRFRKPVPCAGALQCW
jgi:hypothetical protein